MAGGARDDVLHVVNSFCNFFSFINAVCQSLLTVKFAIYILTIMDFDAKIHVTKKVSGVNDENVNALQ